VTDIVDAKTRSRMMSGIRGKNTKPEIIIRKVLFSKGFRYRLHDKRLPGSPDLVFPKYNAVIFIHGCFWHAHECHLFKWPATREEFWKTKITGNKIRDKKNIDKLLGAGWRVLIIWECATKGRGRHSSESIGVQVAKWLQGSSILDEIKGKKTDA